MQGIVPVACFIRMIENTPVYLGYTKILGRNKVCDALWSPPVCLFSNFKYMGLGYVDPVNTISKIKRK